MFKLNLLEKTLKSISPLDAEAMKLARDKWDSLVKPIGSLGQLEEMTIKLSGITGSVDNELNKKAIVVMCSDNGVVEEGVSSAPQEFTMLLAESMARKITGVATLAEFVNADIITVDIGLKGKTDNMNIINKKIAGGTNNFTKTRAMSCEDAVKSIEIGIEIGDMLFKNNYDIIGAGELGIGNTTTSAAILSVLGELDVEITCGKGAGLTDEQHKNKKEVILKGIEVNKPDKEDPIDVLSKVGGFDIGGMCGLFLSAAKNRKPIVMDGFISSAAALCAIKLNSLVKEYIVPSHLSHEPGAQAMMEVLGFKPMLNMEMRLGEGSGCPLAFQILDIGLHTLKNMGTFEEASIKGEVLVNIREK